MMWWMTAFRSPVVFKNRVESDQDMESEGRRSERLYAEQMERCSKRRRGPTWDVEGGRN